MNSLKVLCTVAALTIAPACNDAPKEEPQVQSSALSEECRAFRAMIGAEIALDDLRADPNGERELLGMGFPMALEINAQAKAAMKSLQDKGEDPIECAKAKEE